MKRIELTKGLFAIVDPDDFEKVSRYKWCASDHAGKDRPTKLFYAIHRPSRKNRSGKRVKAIRMHRFVLDYWGRKVVDHINGNTLDNRKENLRIVSRSENNRNLKCHREQEIFFPPPLPGRLSAKNNSPA